jgi:hypothetical protein
MNITIPIIAAVSAALILAPAAKADPADINYLQELMAMNLTPATLHAPPGTQGVIALGHGICQDLGKGRDPNGMVSAIERSLPNLTQNQVQFLISAAVTNYCPDYPKQLPWVQALYPQS